MTRLLVILSLANQGLHYHFDDRDQQALATYVLWLMDNTVKVLFLVVARALLKELDINISAILDTHSNIALLMSLSGLFVYDILAHKP
jgi:hypothetical protein